MNTRATPRQGHRHLGPLLAWLLLGLTVPAAPAPLAQLRSAIAAAHIQPLRPDFTLTDTGGKPRRLADYRGQPVALFFFCGCPWCQRCAETWGRFQRGGALAPSADVPPNVSDKPPVTLVVFSGDAPAAQAFAAQTGLDPSQTVLLPDPDLRVTSAYHADPCPRVFVLDRSGSLRYTNDHGDDAARQAPALAIASRTLDGLRADAQPQPATLPAEAAEAAAPSPVSTLPVTTPDGRPLDLATRPGWKVVYFWSATCPCVRACESFTFVPLSLRYAGRVSFYAVASDGYDLKLPSGQLTSRIKQHGLPFPVLLDATHQAARTLGAKVTPQAFLLDPQNRVVFAGIPDDSRRYREDVGHWGVSKSYLAQAIAQALAGQPVTVPRVKDEGCIISW